MRIQSIFESQGLFVFDLPASEPSLANLIEAKHKFSAHK